MNKETSWGEVAEWYHSLLGGEGTYQKDVILPNLLRVLKIREEEHILDLACGEGFFSREYEKAGARVAGVDISPELIEIAKAKSPEVIDYKVGSADDLRMIDSSVIDKITIILALQNIENLAGVVQECSRVLKPLGRLFIVLNHPAFRIPKASEWGFDERKVVQYRRIDRYLSETREEIIMNPGKKDGRVTVSFHRPLQVYFKVLSKNGFLMHKLEEWISNKKSQKGPRKIAEDRARKEIPLFLFLEAIKYGNA